MSISSSLNRFSNTGTGAQTVFPMTNCLVYVASHVQVYLAGVLQTTGYTVSGVNDPAGAIVTFSVAPGNGVSVVLLRVVPNTQETSYKVAGAFPAKTTEKDLDLAVMRIQQVSEENDRAPKLPVTSPLVDVPFPAPGASQFIRWNAGGTALEAVDAPTQGGTPLAVLSGFTKAGLPAAGNAGRLARVTDNVRGVWMDNGSAWIKLVPEVLVGDFGTDGAAIQSAINAADASTTAYKTVKLEARSYSGASTITIPSRIRLIGAGSRETVILYTGTSSAVTITDGVYHSLSHLRIEVTSTASTVRALHLIATTSNPQQPQLGTYNDLVLQGPSINSGQIGLYLDATAGGASQATFNLFHDIKILSFARPIVEAGANEGNRYSDVVINGYGTGTDGYGIESASHTSQYLNFDFRLGSGVATNTYGFRLTGQSNVAIGMADLGASGFLFSVTGTDNTVLGQVITPTTFGTNTGGYTLALGRSKGQAGGYEVTANTTTGSNRSVFASSVLGFSNGFTIDYNNAAPQTMRYSFIDGPVGLGVVPSLSGVAGPYTRVIATASLPAAGAANDGLMLIEDAAVGDRNLIIYAGGQRFRIDGGAAF